MVAVVVVVGGGANAPTTTKKLSYLTSAGDTDIDIIKLHEALHTSTRCTRTEDTANFLINWDKTKLPLNNNNEKYPTT